MCAWRMCKVDELQRSSTSQGSGAFVKTWQWRQWLVNLSAKKHNLKQILKNNTDRASPERGCCTTAPQRRSSLQQGCRAQQPGDGLVGSIQNQATGEDSLLVFIPTFFIRLGDKNGIRQSGIIKIGAGDLWNLLLLCLEVDIQVILEGNTEWGQQERQQNLLSRALDALQDLCQLLRLCLLAFLSNEEWEECADLKKVTSLLSFCISLNSSRVCLKRVSMSVCKIHRYILMKHRCLKKTKTNIQLIWTCDQTDFLVFDVNGRQCQFAIGHGVIWKCMHISHIRLTSHLAHMCSPYLANPPALLLVLVVRHIPPLQPARVKSVPHTSVKSLLDSKVCKSQKHT